MNKKKLNIFVVIIMFFSILLPIFEPKPVEANSVALTEDDYYTIGSVLNSTQDGRSSKTFYREMVDLGRDIIDTAQDNGIRLSRIIRRRGTELLFNPANFWEIFAQAWQDGANFHITQIKNSGTTFVINFKQSMYLDNEKGRSWERILFNEYPAYPFEIGKTDVQIEVIGDNLNFSNSDGVNNVYNVYAGFKDDQFNNNSRTISSDKLGLDVSVTGHGTYVDSVYDGNSFIYRGVKDLPVGIQVHRYSRRGEFRGPPIHLKKIIITDTYELMDYKALVPFNEVPPVHEMKLNFSSTFKEIVDEDENFDESVWYSYDVNKVVNNNFNVNNNFVKNDYVEVIVQKDETGIPGEPIVPEEPTDPDPKPDPDPDPKPDPDDPDHSGILQKILTAIKNLPGEIFEKFKDVLPESSESGGGFWSNLFDAITELAKSFGDLITSLPQLVLDLLDGILGLVGKIIELFIPTSEQLESLKNDFSILTEDFKLKFKPITDIGSSINSIFASPKSLFDLTIKIGDEELHVMPPFLEEQISHFRLVLSGGVLLATVIEIYKRFVGREDLIK